MAIGAIATGPLPALPPRLSELFPSFLESFFFPLLERIDTLFREPFFDFAIIKHSFHHDTDRRGGKGLLE
jgi:hypothetical protein